MFWVGKLGSQAVSAVGVSGFYTHLIWAISSIITVGTSIRVSHALGAENRNEAKVIAMNAVKSTWALSLLFTVLMFIGKPWLGSFFNLSVEGGFDEYFVWMALGLVFTQTTNVLASVSMSHGDSKTPFRFRSIGIGINLVLTPFFIYVLGMGINGAGLATFLSQLIVALLFYGYKHRDYLGDLKAKLNREVLIPIVKLGVSPSVQRIIFSLASIAIGKIVAEWGQEAIAAQKVGHQLEAMTFMTIGGLSGAMMSFSGQNFGAKQYGRIKEAYRVTLRMALVFGVLMTLLLYTQSEPLMRLFVQDQKTVEIGMRYLQIVGLSQVFMIIEMLTTSLINGLGETKLPARVNILILLSRIPLALFLARPDMLGIDGVWWTIFISTFFRGLVISIIYQKTMRSLESNQYSDFQVEKEKALAN